jgi:hypothetical protein
MLKKVRHLEKTLDLKSRMMETRKRTLYMVVACDHRWASGWSVAGSDGAIGKRRACGDWLGLGGGGY